MTDANQNYASTYHVPIMVSEVLEYLDVAPGKTFIDGTLGGGGHTQAILDASAPDGVVFGIDRDPEARAFASERLSAYGDRFQTVAGNYGDVEGVLARLGVDKVDGFLVDAGISSHQVDEAARGFSFREEGPLDMRMGPDSISVADYLEDVDLRDLSYVLKKYGELKFARPMARAILAARDAGTLKTTLDLADCVDGIGTAPWKKARIHPATLVFQALRIEVNKELEGLERAVEAVPNVVCSGGRAVFISFHSLEDRIVKQGLRALAESPFPPGVPVPEKDRKGKAEVLTRKPVMASEKEILSNPRSRSAKLRAVRVF